MELPLAHASGFDVVGYSLSALALAESMGAIFHTCVSMLGKTFLGACLPDQFLITSNW